MSDVTIFLRFASTTVALAVLVYGAGVVPVWAEPPKVVASIAPVHSLVSGVMKGLGTPKLLLKGGASPHTYALRPSDAKALQSAHLVFWIGEDLERFLIKPLKTLGRKARKVALIEAEGGKVLNIRKGGVWNKHDDGHGHEHGKSESTESHGKRQEHGDHDPHIWLDPRNAKAMVAAIVTALIKADRGNAATYRANGARLNRRLDALDRETTAVLAPVRRVPFVVFHDAYQYFERRYGLAAAGSLTLDPGRTPGARRLSEIRKTIRARHARCVFAEPQFQPGLVATTIEGTGARAATLDPLGARITPSENAYFTLMRRLSASLTACLKGSS